jgi:hypothetical protein
LQVFVMPRDAAVLQSLADKLHAMEHSPRHVQRASILTGWKAIDDALGGLAVSVVHEWFAAAGTVSLPPVGLLLHLARQALAVVHSSLAVWIGQRCWPNMSDHQPFAGRSILLDVADPAQRVWAAELALRCPSVACCVLDGQALTMPMSRRLQIAASAGHALALVARPGRETAELSAAGTRWQVSPQPGPTPRWTVELLRCKGMRPTSTGERPRWVVEPAPWP